LNSTWGREDWSRVLIEALGQESSVALGGVRLISAAGRTLHVPRIVTDPTADWRAELAELPSDAGNADTIELTPKKLGNVVVLSRESIEDSPVSELNSVGRSMVRGIAQKVDAKFFSAEAATATAPAGILNDATLPATVGMVNIDRLIGAVGGIGGEGGVASVIWVSPADLTSLRKATVSGGFAISDPSAPGIERIAGVQLVMTAALPAGVAVAADSRYVVAAVRRDASVEFSQDAAFSRDAVMARVTMRLDWQVADRKAIHVIKPS